jgi:hypothetical protein
VSRNRRKLRSGRRGAVTAAGFLVGLLRIGLPLVLIGGLAFMFLNYRMDRPGKLRVTTSLPGADIYVDGSMTGFISDTTLPVDPGRRIITVRKPKFVSDPEFVVLNIERRNPQRVHFVIRRAEDTLTPDVISPLPASRQETFSTGQPVRYVPPVTSRYDHHLVDFSSRSAAGSSVPNNPAPGRLESPSVPTPVQGGERVSTIETALISTQITVTSVPDAADIAVNGGASSHKTPYTFRGLDRGRYVFRVLRDGYVANPESISVVLNSDFQSELASFELREDSSIPRPSLVISTDPLAAGFKVNNRPAGVGKATLDPGFGTVKIEFNDVPGYKTPAPISVDITAAQPHAEATGYYEKLVGNAFLAVRPSEEIEKFNGSQLRIFLDNELLLDGPKQRFDATLLGKILAGRHLVRIQYGEVSTDITLNLEDGQVSELVFRVESFFSKQKLRLRDKGPVPIEEWRKTMSKANVLAVT